MGGWVGKDVAGCAVYANLTGAVNGRHTWGGRQYWLLKQCKQPPSQVPLPYSLEVLLALTAPNSGLPLPPHSYYPAMKVLMQGTTQFSAFGSK